MKNRTAVKLTIEALTKAQKQYNVGHRQEVNEPGLFDWAKRDHLQWQKLETAKGVIRQMESDLQQLPMMFGAQSYSPSPPDGPPDVPPPTPPPPPSQVQEGSK